MPTLRLSTVAEAEAALHNPPLEARPRVWWPWMNGNVTKQGITRDLEWMSRIGVAGFQLFDFGSFAPRLVSNPVSFLSPQWRALIAHTAAEAERLGLEFTVTTGNNSDVSGGPWVPASEGMKKYVWSETSLQGGRLFDGPLPMPPAQPGPFQDTPPNTSESGVKEAAEKAGYYVDERVIAYRQPDAERELTAPVSISSSDRHAGNLALLCDGRFNRSVRLAPESDGTAWVQFDYGHAVTIRSLRLALAPTGGSTVMTPAAAVLVSDDGSNFRVIALLADLLRGEDTYPEPSLSNFTLALPQIRARFFRLQFGVSAAETVPGTIFYSTEPKSEFQISEAAFSLLARPHRFEAKAAFALPLVDYAAAETPTIDAPAVINPRDVVDISANMQANGRLRWTPPEGRWTVIRLGYSLTGTPDRLSSSFTHGWEVDKLSKSSVERFIAHRYAVFANAIGANAPSGIKGFLTDSWDVGQANWTPDMLAQFKRRRGYDPVPFLPVLADHVVGSALESDRFLWDFRRTLADMLAENHYKTIAEFATQHDLAYYAEAPGVSLQIVADGLQLKQYPSSPMSEIWQMADPRQIPTEAQQVADIREAASAAHIYGQNIAATETFTSYPAIRPYSATPWRLKPTADRAFALGVNQIIIHVSPHQPLEREPGFSLWAFGEQFSRHETWAELASPWIAYLSRSSALLQQGQAVADIAYFYGEGAAVTVPHETAMRPAIPPGYAADFVNRDVLLNEITVNNGRLVTRSGTSFALLVVPAGTQRLTLALISKLRELVRAGAVLVASPPIGAAGLTDRDEAVLEVARDLWRGLAGNATGVVHYGKGNVYVNTALPEVLRAEHIEPDFTFTGTTSTDAGWIHRRLSDGDVFFISNRSGRTLNGEASFRTQYPTAQLWHADNATIETSPAYARENGKAVPLSLPPHEAVFVVFRNGSSDRPISGTLNPETLLTLNGGWSVAFQPGRGAPRSTYFSRLKSWPDEELAGIRYFAGVATYSKTFELPSGRIKKGDRIVMELGQVHDVARIVVNHVTAGIVWKPPYALDVSAMIREGRNELRIDVANTWENRIIGDLRAGKGRRYTFTTNPMIARAYGAKASLAPAGLLGPVRVSLVGPENRLDH